MLGDKGKKRLIKEIQKLEKAFQIETNPKSLLQLAEAYRKVERLPEAIELLRKGIDLYPDNSIIVISYARFALTGEVPSEKLDEIKTMLQQIVLEKPDNLAAQRLLHQIGESRDAQPQDLLSKTDSSENSENEEEIDVIKIAYQLIDEGDPEKALAIFQTILERNPDDEEAQKGFTIAYTALVQMQKLPEQETTHVSSTKIQLSRHMYVLSVLQKWEQAVRNIKKSRMSTKRPEES